MRIGSLFTGYGGLDLAVEAFFGARTVWTSDIDPGACKIIAHRMPHAPNIGDVTTVDWSTVEPIDILTGGYPCQPFSQAGKRKGTDDERHLWPYVRDAIRHLRPRVAILENVAGHRSMGFDRVLGDLAEDGLHARWVSLRAADVGAAHGRERVFIIATDGTQVGREGRWWPTRDGRTGSPAHGGESASDASSERHGRGEVDRGVGRVDGEDAGPALERQRARQVVGDRGEAASADAPTHGPSRLADRSSSQEACGGRQRDVAGDDRVLADADAERRRLDRGAHDAIGEPIERTAAPGGGEEPAPNPKGKRRRKGRPQPEGVPRRPDVDQCRAQDWGRYEPAIRRWERVTGRHAPRPVEQTKRGSWRLSPWFDVPGISWNEVIAALGNGVVPQQAYEALRRALP